MREADMLLTIRSSTQRYVVRRDHVRELRLMLSDDDLERPDERGKALICCELDQVLHGYESYRLSRRHALIVHLRRRSVALLIDRIEDARPTTELEADMCPLPTLLSRRLARPWFLGVLVRDEIPLLVLDLRQIAQDVLLQQQQHKQQAETEPKG
jgi:chemotaxis signal transduction protein